ALRVRSRIRTQGPLPRPSAAPVLRVPLRMTAPVLDAERLRGLAEDALDDTLRSFADAHGAEALPALAALASGAERAVRRAAKRALYRLAQRGVTPPPRPAPRPVVERAAERATRAWVSGVDGSGSRAVWILFEGGFGGATLCSLIVNDTAGILEVAGGEITKRRLAAALAELPETAGWFLDPEAVQADAVDLLAARESRLVVSDQTKAEREDAIVGRVIARELGPEARRRWARRLAEMALVFDATERA